MKLSKTQKIFLAAFFASVINIKLFLFFTNLSQVLMIMKYSGNLFNFINAISSYYYTFLSTVPLFALILYIIFTFTIIYFWWTYFQVFFNRLSESKIHGGAKYKFLANFFTFLGFGCVACGQTLLYSILLFFGSNSLLFLGEYIGHGVMIIGIMLLIFGIFENKRLLKNKNICKI